MPPNPYMNFRFTVEIEGFVRAGFQRISGLEHNVEVVEYREGGDNDSMRKLPGQSSFPNVVMERGMTADNDFEIWMKLIYDPARLGGTAGQGNTDDYRKDLTIFLHDKAGNQVKKWTVLSAWPASKKLSDLDATASEVTIETLELATEGINEETLA